MKLMKMFDNIGLDNYKNPTQYIMYIYIYIYIWKEGIKINKKKKKIKKKNKILYIQIAQCID
jgi:hypothetical protein